MSVPHKAGFVAIVGAPNAGKSTLLNRILGEKVAIVTSKPQTTRHRILGVHTQSRPPAQLVFWDTPGLHRPGRAPLNQEMMNQALTALTDSDLALWVVDSLRRGPENEIALEILLQNRRPLIVALNKTDAATDKSRLLPLIREIQTQAEPEAVVPISARTGDGLPALLTEIIRLLPENPPLYPEDTLTDQAERDIAAELIREAVFKLTNQEIPYSTTVTIDEFKAEPSIVHISATIHVEKDSQKGVIIGARGSKLKKIGQTARISIEHLLNSKVYLSLFISARA